VDVSAITNLIDTALADFKNRSLVSSEEFMNLLLDIRCNIHTIDVTGDSNDNYVDTDPGRRENDDALDDEGAVLRSD
jgi:hypothetical protein